MSHLTRTLVIWLNSVTIVAQTVPLLPAHICAKMSTPVVSCTVSDGLVNAMPNMQKMLLQFINVVHPRLIHL